MTWVLTWLDLDFDTNWCFFLGDENMDDYYEDGREIFDEDPDDKTGKKGGAAAKKAASGIQKHSWNTWLRKRTRCWWFGSVVWELLRNFKDVGSTCFETFCPAKRDQLGSSKINASNEDNVPTSMQGRSIKNMLANMPAKKKSKVSSSATATNNKEEDGLKEDAILGKSVVCIRFI